MNVPLSIEIILYLLTQLTFLIALWSRNFYYLYYVDEETEALAWKNFPGITQLETGFKPNSMLLGSNPRSRIQAQV